MKYQQGGVFTPPFAVYQGYSLPSSNTAPEESKSSSDKSESPIKLTDVFKLLDNLKALPGDFKSVQDKLQILFDSIHEKIRLGDTSSIAQEYLMIVNLVSNLEFATNEYANAKQQASENGGLHEYAIDSRGRVIVATEDGFEWKTPEEIFKNPNKYVPITNSELLNYRQQGAGGLAFDSKSLEVVTNGIGIDQVTKSISDTIKDLGTNKQEETFFIGVKKGDLLQGLNDFLNELKKSGNYNASINDLVRTQYLSEDQANQAELALSYIFRTLNPTAQALLKMKSNGTAEGAFELITSLITSKLSSGVTMRSTMESGTKSGSGSGSGNTSGTDAKRSFILDVQAGQGGGRGVFELNKQSHSKMSTDVDLYSYVQDLDGGSIQTTSMQNMLDKSGLISIIEKGKPIFFGEQEISESKLQDIVYGYDTRSFARVELPTDGNGHIRFELLDIIEKLNSEILVQPEKANVIIKDYCEKHPELNYYFYSDGTKKQKYFEPFLVFDGLTTRDLVGINTEGTDKNKFVVKIGSDKDMFDNLSTHLTEANPASAKKYNKDTYRVEWLNDPLYKGVVYLPLNMNKEAAIIGGQQKIDIDDIRYELSNQLSIAGYNQVDYSGAEDLLGN